MDLTQGGILGKLVKLAVPIMLTSFLQMAYNLTDMIWIGRVGSSAVAAVGTAGFYLWLSFAFIRLSQVGVEIGVSQNMGRKEPEKAAEYARGALLFNGFWAILFAAVAFIFRHQAIGFFNITDAAVNGMAVQYLAIVCFGLIFSFTTPILSGIYNGCGDSHTPLVFNGIGLVINVILDPIMIFGFGPFPVMGVAGAAYATILAQAVVMVLFLSHLRSAKSPFPHFEVFKKPKISVIKHICQMGVPVAVQSAGFTIFAMIIARLIASWGPIPIAVQKVGSQIESISWMTASGFSTALSAFTGQNFGAGDWKRIYKGYYTAMGIMSAFGIFTSLLLILLAEPIFSIFIPEAEAIRQGAIYLRILGVSQLFMCLEIATSGAFNGLGRTMPPSVVSFVFTGLRVPAAFILSTDAMLGLSGIWWSISISSIIKGILLVTWFVFVLRAAKRNWLDTHLISEQ